jgi:hypothetical protein
LEQPVTRAVPERVIDVLEAVEVDEQRSRRQPMPASSSWSA